VPDGETGKDGMAELPLWNSSSKASHKETTKLKDEWPVAYCQWIIKNCGHMDTERLQDKGQAIVVRLPEIYIPLYTMDPKKEARSKTQAATPDSRQTPVKLETLIAQNPSTLVEGHPGSDKTTLLKHLAFCRWLSSEQKDGQTYFLPSEIQWQIAAAGKAKREFPWEGEIRPEHCNYRDTKIEKTSAAEGGRAKFF
jgi:hypothetical protein